ncbi:unnamed protein product, partial [Polarella glacialis]
MKTNHDPLVSQNIRIVPYAALSFSSFEVLKLRLRQRHGVSTDMEVPLSQRLAAGSASGVMAQLFAYPLHTVRRRMQGSVAQDELGALGSISYDSTRESLRRITATEGMLGLFKGASITWVKAPVTLGIAFAVNDGLK